MSPVANLVRLAAERSGAEPKGHFGTVERFVARENIRHFADRLATETDSPARALLKRLLVLETDKLGQDTQALRELDTHIARAQEQVHRQQTLLISMERDGRDAAQVMALLDKYSDVLLAFKNQRDKLMVRLREFGL